MAPDECSNQLENPKPSSVKQLTIEILSETFLEAEALLKRKIVPVKVPKKVRGLRYRLLYNSTIRKYRRLRSYKTIVRSCLKRTSCFLCNMELASREQLTNHLKIHRRYLQDKINTDVITSSSSRTVQKQEKASHNQIYEQTEFPCMFCDEIFPNAQALSRHQCEVCDG